METGTKEMVKKEENNDRFSTLANAGDRQKPLEKAKRSIGSMFRRSVKVEISPAEVENTESGQPAKPLNQEPSQPASSRIVMKKEETSDNWSTMAIPEMPLSIYRKSLSENSRKKKMQETRSCQPSKAMNFVNGALVDTSVSPVSSTVPAVPANGFISSSKLKDSDKAKRTAMIESSPIEIRSNGSTVRDESARTTATPSDTGAIEHSIWESGSEDRDDGCNNADSDENDEGSSRQHHVEANPNDATDDCDGGQFGCLDCAAVFETDAAFNVHIASHPGYRRFKCAVCEKRFTRSEHIKVHMRTHTGEKSFVCDVCDKMFTTNGQLTVHKRIHTGVKPFKCDVCNQCFTESWSLTMHKRIHTGDKAFECLTCHKRFTQSGNLQRHDLIHTGEQPFKCDVCDKKFTTNGNLTKHKRIHTGEQPFNCDVCKKGFTESGSLKVHMRIHTGEKPYKCLSCGKCFRDIRILKRHKRTQHSDADAGSQLDVSQNGMDQSSTTDACAPLVNSVSGQKIRYRRKSIDCVLEKMASRNPDILYLVWSKKFTMELAAAVARSGYNCILCVKKIEPQPFRDVVKLSDGLHTCLVEVGPDSKTLRLFSFGGMFLSEKITNHGTFKSLAKLESKMRRFAISEGMEMVNIYKHSERNSGWYRSLKDGLKGDCIITDKI